MAHAQKPDLVFQRNGRVHLYRRGCQFSRLLAVEVYASAVVMLDRPCSDTVHDCWLPPAFALFPFTSPPVRFRVPSHSVSALPKFTSNFNWYLLYSVKLYLYLNQSFAEQSISLCFSLLQDFPLDAAFFCWVCYSCILSDTPLNFTVLRIWLFPLSVLMRAALVTTC